MGLKNKDGVDMKEIWSNGISSYLGLAVNGFPNAFMVYSPQGKSCSTSFSFKLPLPTILFSSPATILFILCDS